MNSDKNIFNVITVDVHFYLETDMVMRSNVVIRSFVKRIIKYDLLENYTRHHTLYKFQLASR